MARLVQLVDPNPKRRLPVPLRWRVRAAGERGGHSGAALPGSGLAGPQALLTDEGVRAVSSLTALASFEGCKVTDEGMRRAPAGQCAALPIA